MQGLVAITNPYIRRITAADITRSTTTTSTIPELDLPLPVGRWCVRYTIIHQSPATTTGIRVGVAGTGGLVLGLISGMLISYPTATTIIVGPINALNVAIISTAVQVANTNQTSYLDVTLNVTTTGTLRFIAGSEVAANCVYKIGTYVEARPI